MTDDILNISIIVRTSGKIYRCLYSGTSVREFLNGIWQHMFLRLASLNRFAGGDCIQ